MTSKERREKAADLREQAQEWDRQAEHAKTERWLRICGGNAADLRNEAYYLERGV